MNESAALRVLSQSHYLNFAISSKARFSDSAAPGSSGSRPQALADMDIVAVVNGYNIRRVPRVMGVFYAVEGTGRSFLTQGEAMTSAESAGRWEGEAPESDGR